MSTLVVLLALVVGIALAIALAYFPMRLLLGQMARNVREFIARKRERRSVSRTTPDRRKVG